MRTNYIIPLFAFILVLCIPLIVPAQTLTIYSGRSKALVEPVIKKFEAETGIRVRVRYGGTTQLAVAIMEERRRSPADLFWAQDAGALEAVSKEGLFSTLSSVTLNKVPSEYRDDDEKWVSTSSRARVFAYSSDRVRATDIPETIYDLTNPRWANRLGWAPTNGSFQAFLTTLRKSIGDEQTLEWLKRIRANGVQNYANNNAILQAIAAGEIDGGLTNHYYLYRYLETNSNFPVNQTFFKEGDPGNLVNVSGIGILNSSRNKEPAERFIDFLLSQSTQEWFAQEIFEYPVIDGIRISLREGNSTEMSPDVNYDELGDLDVTLRMLREAGLL